MRRQFAVGIAAAALAVFAVVAIWRADDPEGPGMVRIVATPVTASTVTATIPVEARRDAAMIYELHGTSPRGSPPTAMLALHGEKSRIYAVGQAVGVGVVLETVAGGHVLLREGGQLARIDLPPRLGGSGEPVAASEKGLRPEPRPPTGELSGAQMAAIRAVRRDTPAPVPVEEIDRPEEAAAN